ncbi:helix-turn-helix transcriptional regulator [Streptomyces sp. C184]|uniref:helix-turn-helix transcriptional regulator n=1 Tax=Streptomyces sp. C184 TaxID=3237121 RepID=UPI0034C6CC73
MDRGELDALTGHVRSFAAMLTEREGKRPPDWLNAVSQVNLPGLHTRAPAARRRGRGGNRRRDRRRGGRGGGRLRFRYVDQHGRPSTRLVEPYRHFLRAGHWYLVAFDVDRDDWRTFRLDRLTDISPVAGTYQPHKFPDASIEQWLTTDFGRATARSSRSAAKPDR